MQKPVHPAVFWGLVVIVLGLVAVYALRSFGSLGRPETPPPPSEAMIQQFYPPSNPQPGSPPYPSPQALPGGGMSGVGGAVPYGTGITPAPATGGGVDPASPNIMPTPKAPGGVAPSSPSTMPPGQPGGGMAPGAPGVVRP
ncbi:MAG: hypothetical protein HY320_09670 [Armatimonadetes bacterium]|nr:hypothetical protein [Armatimonadota bacterium]